MKSILVMFIVYAEDNIFLKANVRLAIRFLEDVNVK